MKSVRDAILRHKLRKDGIEPRQTALFGDDPTIQERFVKFHTAHPEVYDELVRLARQGTAAGRHRLGIKQLFEVLRWHRIIAGLPDAGEDFKLNNSYSSRYARMIMANEPDLEGVFELRELKA